MPALCQNMYSLAQKYSVYLWPGGRYSSCRQCGEFSGPAGRDIAYGRRCRCHQSFALEAPV